MPLLITGPAASGKSTAALARFRSIPGSLLIVPTATMAEHLRHQLTREGHLVRPSQVRTIAQFLDGLATQSAAPPNLVNMLIEQALELQRPARFRAVAEYEGVRAALANLFDEAPAAVLPGDLAGILNHVEQELSSRGKALRKARLAEAARRVSPMPGVVFDGFFTFSQDEVGLLIALSRQTDVVVTLPDWPAASRAREDLLRTGFEEQRLSGPLRSARQVVISTATAEREAEEIARRIAEENAVGRPFREIGIVLRSRDPYAPLLTTTLGRFGIPARAYFSDSLDTHPAIQYLMSVLQSLLTGWDHATLLPALRMPVSGIGATPEGDRLDFEWRKALPGRGLPSFPAVAALPLATLEPWRRDRVSPEQWAGRLKSLRRLIPIPRAEDQVSRLRVDAWRSTAAALDAFDEAVDRTAEALGTEAAGLGSFCNLARQALRLGALRTSDRRRDVVHIMDVFEARQWELPVVFVCGLVERHFPQYHREDPILGDAARRRAGLDTAADRQAQERSLFDFAISRASEQVILSYPRFNEKGEDTLRSFFLEREGEPRSDMVLPAEAPAGRPGGLPHLAEEEFRKRLADQHRSLSPSSIESFTQCPFKFFAYRTLRLQERPPEPRDRLGISEQGSILHRVLREWAQNPLFGVAVFDQVFEEECSRLRVPRDYRTEAIRLEMLRNFTAYITSPQSQLSGWETRVEQDFQFQLYPGLAIRGRIDRLEVNARGQALVIDYKYSAANKIRERVERSEQGREVQTGLYLLAAERKFHLKPVGMLFCGLRKGIHWEGWHLAGVGVTDAGDACRPEDLEDVMRTAERVAREAHEQILSGRIAVDPTDRKQCQWCDYRDACRVEVGRPDLREAATDVGTLNDA